MQGLGPHPAFTPFAVLYTTPRTWHPHIYNHPPKRSTPHSIEDILGYPRLHGASPSCSLSPGLRHGHSSGDDSQTASELFQRCSAFAELSPSPMHAFHAVHRDPSPRINVTDVDSESEHGKFITLDWHALSAHLSLIRSCNTFPYSVTMSLCTI